MTADSEGDGGWGDSDPSVFDMKFSGRLEGEYQVTNGYGIQKAPQVMRVSHLIKLCTINLYSKLKYIACRLNISSLVYMLSLFYSPYYFFKSLFLYIKFCSFLSIFHENINDLIFSNYF